MATRAITPPYFPAISADGRYVTFDSDADNLVPGDTNGISDIFLYDRQTNSTTRVSVDSNGNQSNNSSSSSAISIDGRYITFYSEANNLVPGDTNGISDIFLYDRQTNSTTRVSVDSNGNQSNDNSYAPAISADGRYITFGSYATNLVPGGTNNAADVFVYDRQTGTTSRISVDSNGNPGNSSSSSPAISADGRYVTFDSEANNLVSGDTNGISDIFLYDRLTGITTRISTDANGNQSNYRSFRHKISADGRYVTFYSEASNLVPGDVNDTADIFVRDLSLLPTAVNIRALDAVATEPPANDTATYRIGRSGNATGALTLDLTLSSSFGLLPNDYILSGGNIVINGTTATVVIPDGQSVVDLTLIAIADGQQEPDETLTLTLEPSSSYEISGTDSAAVTIQAPPLVDIVALDPTAEEPPANNPGVYRISRSKDNYFSDPSIGDLTVKLTLSGSPTLTTSDYSLTGGSIAINGTTATVIIPDGQSFVDLTLTPVDDLQAEPDETLTLSLVNQQSGQF